MKKEQQSDLKAINAQLEAALAQKNHQLEIEAALERVRTVAMGMRTPDNLLDICKVLFEELTGLGFSELRNAMINIVNDEKGSFLNYDFNGKATSTTQFSFGSHLVIDRQIEITRSGGDAFIEHLLTGSDFEDFKAFRVKNGEAPDPRLENISALYYYFYSIGDGSVGISVFSPLKEEKREILKRFRNVFDLAYRRYVDIEQAEAQAREAQIQLALERVRARTMAMQRSEELAETVFILFQQFKELGENPDQATIGIINENERVIEYWVTMYGSQENKVYKFSIDEPIVTGKIYNAWQHKKKSLVIDLSGKELLDFAAYRESMGGAKLKKGEQRRIINVAFFSRGLINVQSVVERSEESVNLLERFAAVFEATYTRFLDLKQAEAQAREAQIEAALEKVRSRSLAMHKSDELRDVVKMVFERLQELNFGIDGAAFIVTPGETSEDLNIWIADDHAEYPNRFRTPYYNSPINIDLFEAIRSGSDFISRTYSFAEKNRWFEYAFEHTDYKYLPAELRAWILDRESITQCFALTKNSGVGIHFHDRRPLSESEIDILKRFSKVFEQAYTRFLDLEKAEIQAREAQIEAALERVRSRTMAMQKPEELNEVIKLIYDQLVHLGLEMTSAGFVMDYKETNDLNVWVCRQGQEYSSLLHVPYFDHPIFNLLIDSKQKGLDFYTITLTKEEKDALYRHAFEYLPNWPQERRDYVYSLPGYADSHVLMNQVLLYIQNFTGIPYSEQDNEVLKRFGKVFEQTYTRFKDLEQAEAQARESQIQLALERVRARTMAMQKSEELHEVIQLIFDQLNQLDFKIHAANFALNYIETDDFDLWVAVHGSQYATKIHIPYLKHPGFDLINQAKQKGGLLTITLSLEEKNSFFEHFFKYAPTVTDERKAMVFGCPGYASSIALMKNTALAIINYDGIPYSEAENNTLFRFGQVFDQTYTRFNDLKQAETQAREAQIQLALERVRARTAAMQKSDELAETVSVLFKQLLGLGIPTELIRTCGIVTFDEKEAIGEQWVTEMNGDIIPRSFMMPYDEAPAYKTIYQWWKKGREFEVNHLHGEALQEHLGYLAKYIKIPSNVLTEESDDIYNHVLFFSRGYLFIITRAPVSDYHEVFKRFGAIFQQSYTRFLDLQKAEEQARESQIQLGLERVRAAAMAMHNSQDVGNATALVFSELYKLGINTIRCGVCIVDNLAEQIEVWSANMTLDGKVNRGVGKLDMTAHPLWVYLLNAWRQKTPSFTYELKGKELEDYYKAIKNAPNYEAPKSLTPDTLPDAKQYCNCYIFNEGCLFAFTEEPFSLQTNQILEKFAAVFGLTYRRYLDLTKAEAQAREGQIEAALERVRSKTMAMHNSADVGETVTLMFNELVKLGVDKIARCGIAIPDDKGLFELWTAKLGKDEEEEIVIGHIDTAIHPMLGALYQAWKRKQPYFEYLLEGDDLAAYISAINNSQSYPVKYDSNTWGTTQYHNDFFFNDGVVFAFTFQPLSAEIAAIFKRFAGVFGQTYRRYLDLRKAEANTREAQIEAALERVRAKAMAMRSSDDLNSTANTVFVELRKLGVDLVRCGVGLLEERSDISTIHAATNSDEGGSLEVLGKLNMTAHPILVGIIKHWQQNRDYFPVLEGELLRSYYEKLHESGITVPEWKSGEKQYGYFFPFTHGSLYAWSGKQETEDTIKTLKRFTSVIGLTFTRYMELQKAELNAKEAIKQASLDRVRAEIASMRTRNDLERITPLIWEELTVLGIPFIRCGVFIMDEGQRLIHTFLSTPNGKAIGAFHVPFDTSGNFEKMVDSWRHNLPYIDHWKEEAFSLFADTLVKQGAIASKAQYMKTLPHDGVHLNFLPFLQGMLYVGNVEPLAEDNITLIQAVAEAFSTAYARYEDFNKLEAAKEQVDHALTQLKSTQRQLIQSEKMASLGELTAGIAHEIQNPLNFVNNFSEVSAELIDEMDEELDKGDIEEVKAIAADIKENLQKIRHHGGRADGIVKGMLQHSRAGSNVKEPTDINKLADEYLHLAYHGLRAKDKSFNAELITHFDEKLPKAHVVPQDIGRVILNMINNAFYATQQKAKTAGLDYKPTVAVTTAPQPPEGGEIKGIMISVRDNGNGIPKAIKEKIMQPFFTNKPAGEGTGLGLSLSYDIVVKGHDGKIDFDTKENEFTEFTVSLPIQ